MLNCNINIIIFDCVDIIVGIVLVGIALLGTAMVGMSVFGTTMVGIAVLGTAMVGMAVLGTAMVGMAVLVTAMVGMAVTGGRGSDGDSEGPLLIFRIISPCLWRQRLQADFRSSFGTHSPSWRRYHRRHNLFWLGIGIYTIQCIRAKTKSFSSL